MNSRRLATKHYPDDPDLMHTERLEDSGDPARNKTGGVGRIGWVTGGWVQPILLV